MGMSRAEIIQIATVNASRILYKYGLLKHQNRIDIFKIIEDEDVVINFQPLDELAGAYIPANEKSQNVNGIIINERLPITRQRYTAAHELSHFLRGDNASIDTESELFMQTYKREDKELIAEEFASCVLMPRNLVNGNLFQIGITNPRTYDFQSTDIYSLALRMGTSYSATVGRMLALKYITREQFEQFIKVRPKKIKRIIGADGIGSSWNDIWDLTESDNYNYIFPVEGDVLRISLPENPTTGYVWRVNNVDDSISLLDESWTSDSNIIGGSGVHVFEYTVDTISDFMLQFDIFRPWLPGSVLRSVKMYISVQTKRHGISENILMPRGA